MGMLVKKDGASRVALAANNLLGRSSSCTLRLDSSKASAEHARIGYRDGDWTVRDLGSRNGTFLNGERLEVGGARQLRSGDEIALGDSAATWTLVDASPPVPMARRLRTDTLLAGTAGILPLPSPEEPRCCVVEDHGGAWHVEVEGGVRSATDGEIIEVDGEPFMLHLPVPIAETAEPERVLRVHELELAFRVSLNEEAVELCIVTPTMRTVLPPRSHHYMLLTLARVRARDANNSGLTPAQRGWVMVDELCRMLATDENKLNVEIYRVRQEMSTRGVSNAAAIVERRRGSRQLRLGTERVSIASLEPSS
jgi:hypothetical protein